MDPALIVEILDRRGRVLERHRLAQLPVTVGRGYGCDVILDDPYVSPEHLRIVRDEDDRLVVVDLDSTNGTHEVERGQRLASMALRPDTKLRVGETILRIRDRAHPTPPAVPIDQSYLARMGSKTIWLAAAAWAIASLVEVTKEYLGTYDDVRADELVQAFTAVTIAVLFWSGAWAVGNRIVSHRFQLIEHFLNVCLWLIVYQLLEPLQEYVSFALDADLAAGIAAWLLGSLVFAGLIYGHLRLASSAPARTAAYGAAGVSASLALLTALVSVAAYLQEPRWDFALRFPDQLKPPMFRLVAGETLDAFLGESTHLQERVDELAKEGK